jgi:hypothetical protein
MMIPHIPINHEKVKWVTFVGDVNSHNELGIQKGTACNLFPTITVNICPLFNNL